MRTESALPAVVSLAVIDKTDLIVLLATGHVIVVMHKKYFQLIHILRCQRRKGSPSDMVVGRKKRWTHWQEYFLFCQTQLHLLQLELTRKMSSKSSPTSYTTVIPEPPSSLPQDCISCRIIGTGAMGAAGLYALSASRPHAPGSVVVKRIVAGVGVCEHCQFLF